MAIETMRPQQVLRMHAAFGQPSSGLGGGPPQHSYQPSYMASALASIDEAAGGSAGGGARGASPVRDGCGAGAAGCGAGAAVAGGAGHAAAAFATPLRPYAGQGANDIEADAEWRFAARTRFAQTPSNVLERGRPGVRASSTGGSREVSDRSSAMTAMLLHETQESLNVGPAGSAAKAATPLTGPSPSTTVIASRLRPLDPAFRHRAASMAVMRHGDSKLLAALEIAAKEQAGSRGASPERGGSPTALRLGYG